MCGERYFEGNDWLFQGVAGADAQSRVASQTKNQQLDPCFCLSETIDRDASPVHIAFCATTTVMNRFI